MLEKHNFISKLILYIGITLFFSAILLLVYAPVIQEDLFYKEDRNQSLGHAGDLSNIMDVAIKEGRYGYAYLLYHLMGHTRSSGSTKVMRLFGILGTALFASVIWTILRRCRFRADHALLISALICTLPTIQLYIVWIVITSYIVSALLSSLSALIMINIIYEEKTNDRRHETIKTITAITLFVASLTIHQTTAMMYWTAGLIAFLTWDNYDFLNKYKSSLVKYFFVGFVSIAIYYVVCIKIIPLAMNFSVARSDFVSVNEIPVKLIKVIIIPFNNAANLWNVEPTFTLAFFIILFIICGIRVSSLHELKETKQSPTSNYFQKYYLILCLLILSYLPNLIVAEHAYTYRTLISLAASQQLCLYCSALDLLIS